MGTLLSVAQPQCMSVELLDRSGDSPGKCVRSVLIGSELLRVKLGEERQQKRLVRQSLLAFDEGRKMNAEKLLGLTIYLYQRGGSLGHVSVA